MKPKHPDDGMYCPLWRKPCVKVCHTCHFWHRVSGTSPTTGQPTDHWDCAYTMQSLLTIESTLAQRQTTATVDKLANEVRQANDAGMANALAGLNASVRRLASADGEQVATLANGAAQRLIGST